MPRACEVDYRIIGDDMQLVEVELDPGEATVAEAGAMNYMDASIQMQTVFGDGSGTDDGSGMMGKLLGAGKRLLAGAGLFMTIFTNMGTSKATVAFAAPYPGKIIPVELATLGGQIVCQKDAFLCAAKGVSVSIAFNRKLGVGLFGGEGFIMERLEGDGLTFLHAGGCIVKKDLQIGERLKVDTGCLVALTSGVDYDIQAVPGIRSALFGGEGLFFATLTGPGTVWLQSLPINRLAHKLMRYAQPGNKREEGSMIGGLGVLGGILGGD